MQKEWNKLLLFAIAVGFKNLMNQADAVLTAVGGHKHVKVDPDKPDAALPMAEQYSAAVKAYKKELGLG